MFELVTCSHYETHIFNSLKWYSNLSPRVINDKKISGLFINLILFIKPLIQPAFYILKMHMHFTLGAYFELHLRHFYHGSILYHLWALISLRGSRKLCQRGSNSSFFFIFFLVDRGGGGIQIPLKAGVIIGPLAKRHLNGVSPADRWWPVM